MVWMYQVEIKDGIKVSCTTPEEVMALVEMVVDARKERERRERREWLRSNRESAKR